jgi:hypothetical protein
MVEQTMKMTESCGVVGVRGQSARSDLRRLDRGVAWTKGAGSTRTRGSTLARASVPRGRAWGSVSGT